MNIALTHTNVWIDQLTLIAAEEISSSCGQSASEHRGTHYAGKLESTCVWSGGRASQILYHGTRLRWIISVTLQSLRSQRKPPYLLYKRMVGPHRGSGICGEERTTGPPARDLSFHWLSHSSVFLMSYKTASVIILTNFSVLCVDPNFMEYETVHKSHGLKDTKKIHF
jgi:hypothetical protein